MYRRRAQAFDSRSQYKNHFLGCGARRSNLDSRAAFSSSAFVTAGKEGHDHRLFRKNSTPAASRSPIFRLGDGTILRVQRADHYAAIVAPGSDEAEEGEKTEDSRRDAPHRGNSD